MRFLYQVMYRIGFTPWDMPETPVPAVLKDVIEGPQAIHSGRALDLGSGMGRHAIYLLASNGAGHGRARASHRSQKSG